MIIITEQQKNKLLGKIDKLDEIINSNILNNLLNAIDDYIELNFFDDKWELTPEGIDYQNLRDEIFEQNS